MFWEWNISFLKNKILNLCFRCHILRSYHFVEEVTCISLPIITNGKPLAVIGEFASATGKLMVGKTLDTNGEEITNALIGNDVLAIYW